MKKFLASIALFGLLSLGTANAVFAQDEAQAPDSEVTTEEVAAPAAEAAPVEEMAAEDLSLIHI